METRVLSALAQGTREGSIRAVARATLQLYRWRDPAHRIIFEALLAMPSESSELARDQLPSRLTRMGFPDLAWEDLFTQPQLSQAEAERLIERLVKNSP
jgi:hypothetical protein